MDKQQGFDFFGLLFLQNILDLRELCLEKPYIIVLSPKIYTTQLKAQHSGCHSNYPRNKRCTG
jgi:hypothetical protein